jgi:uncharacterized protein YjdB
MEFQQRKRGEVTAVAAGEAVITVKTNDGGKTASCTVTVREVQQPVAALEVKITGAISHTTHTKGQIGTVEFSNYSAICV